MMSLANTYSLEELREFYDRVTKETGDTEFACELKFDVRYFTHLRGGQAGSCRDARRRYDG